MPTLISDPATNTSDRTKVTTRLDKEIFHYFFIHIFSGDRGIKQAIINTFFDAFYAECQRRNIPAAWGPENYTRVAAVLADLTFNPPAKKKKQT